MKIRLCFFLSALSFVLLAMTGRSLRAQQPRDRAGCKAGDRLRVGWASRRPAHSRNCAELFRARPVRRRFADHHSVYPTFTMMNSASIATGTYPGAHGFYGNVVYAPSAKGRNAKGANIDFSAPAFIEDFGVVEAVRNVLSGQAHARFDHAAGGPSQRADDLGHRQVRSRLHPGLQSRWASFSTKTRRCRSVSPWNCSKPVIRFRRTASTRTRPVH